jgi:hypothetical protein
LASSRGSTPPSCPMMLFWDIRAGTGYQGFQQLRPEVADYIRNYWRNAVLSIPMVRNSQEEFLNSRERLLAHIRMGVRTTRAAT